MQKKSRILIKTLRTLYLVLAWGHEERKEGRSQFRDVAGEQQIRTLLVVCMSICHSQLTGLQLILSQQLCLLLQAQKAETAPALLFEDKNVCMLWFRKAAVRLLT